jgi:formylglycine-generating enzyme required for sulfatase activity
MQRTTLALVGLGLLVAACLGCPKSKAPAKLDDHPPGTRGGSMVSVPAGDFTMGCVQAKGRCGGPDQPERAITLDAFHIDKREVTISEYQECVKAAKCDPAHFDDSSCALYDGGKNGVLPVTSRGAEQPVVCVTWAQAHAYCDYVGKRLPTDAEWEKAARGTEGRALPWGEDDPTCDRAIIADAVPGCGQKRAWPVGSKPKGASPYGALDMLGNVDEWVADWYEPGVSKQTKNPQGPSSGREHVVRASSFTTTRADARLTHRIASDPDRRSDTVGFRCAK